MSQEWTPPDDKTITEIKLIVTNDLKRGETQEELVDALVTGDGWPRDETRAFVESVDRRRLRKKPPLGWAAFGGGAIGGVVMAVLGFPEGSGAIPIVLALAAAGLVKLLSFRDEF